MSRLAIALTLLAGGLVSLHHDTPEVLSVSAPTFGKHRPQPFRAARGVRRLPLASTPDTAKARNPEPRRGITSPPTPRSADLRPAGALNFAALADCESSGNPHAVSPDGRYFGLYQFDYSTWASVGGVGNPADASPAEQTQRAAILYSRSGAAPWPVCGSYLAGGTA